jgi:3-oxoacyl-[acyl-carrier protein] reductase
MKHKQLIAQYAPHEPPPVALRDDALLGRVVLITGAASGIGESTARRAIALGAKVALLDINKPELQAVADSLRQLGADVLALPGDLSRERFLPRCLERIAKRFGRLDGLVHSAYLSRRGPVPTLSLDDARAVWEVNVGAAVRAVQAALPLLKQSPAASVVFVSSILARYGRPEEVPYASSKCALEGVGRVMAVELAPHRIRVNTVLPGAIQTGHQLRNALSELPEHASERRRVARARKHFKACQNWQPFPVMGRPDVVADPILFLLSDAARFITGVCLPVDGGFHVDGRSKILRPRPKPARPRPAAGAR